MITFNLSYIKSTVQCNLTHKGDVWFIYGLNPWPKIPTELTPGAFMIPADKTGGKILLRNKRTGDISYMYKHDDITIEMTDKTQFIYVGGKTAEAYHVTFESW